MRKALFIAMSLFLSIAYGQEKENSFTIPKKTWYVNGSINLNSQSVKNSSTTNETDVFTFGFSPTAGYAIKDNLIIGLGLGYIHTSYKNSSFSNDSNYDNFQIFPYIKKYFPVGSKLALSLQGEARYSTGENLFNSFNGPTTIDHESYFVGIRPGITFTLNKTFALEANIGSLGYSYSTSNDNFNSNEISTNSFTFDLSTANIFFGLAIFI